jgi:7-cyano-7-deazaguanine synthase
MAKAMAGDSVAVLVSGGLDSAVLLAELLHSGADVHPVYVRAGLFWEAVEERHLPLFCLSLRRQTLPTLTVLEAPAGDLYRDHWSVTGKGVPGADTPDEAVYLPGRNVLLLSKTLLWCHLRNIPALALASLAANPFPDATPAFFAALAAVVGQSVGQRPMEVRCPYLGLHKADVIRRGRDLPLRWTFSCMRPIDGKHCGCCNKCGERRRAFAEAGVADPTDYQESGVRSQESGVRNGGQVQPPD